MSESTHRRLAAIGLAHLEGTPELLPALKKWREQRDKETAQNEASYQEYLQQHPEIRARHRAHKILMEARIRAQEAMEAKEAEEAKQQGGIKS